LTGFLSRIRLETQTGSALTPDNAPDSVAGTGEYVLSGNAWCSNTAPSASLAATPVSGLAPLAVRFDGSGTDADAGDTIATYTFRFGDGTPPVTQSSPTVSHTYATPGTYHATATVTDSRGAESTNTAARDVTVTAGADLAVAASGPATSKNNAIGTYTITITNTGPATATGVVATDTLPLKAVFKSVSVSPTATCTNATASNVTTVTCKLGTLAPSAKATITLQAKLTGTVGQVLTDTASATEAGPGDPHAGNDTSNVSTTVVR
jgi:uncharacterized repeat protein (TIGR01451 family)